MTLFSEILQDNNNFSIPQMIFGKNDYLCNQLWKNK